MQIVAKTDVGLVRKRNEDYFIIAEAQDLVVLCDGMGGHPGGDLASRMVAEEVQRQVTQGSDAKLAVDATAELTLPLAPFVTLLHSVFAADRKLREYGSRHPEYHGMGTTLVVVQEHEGVVFVAHVGDSRVYSFKRGKLTQVTHDHSVVATHPEYAHLAGMRNILTRAMGVGEELEVDFVIAPAEAGEVFMLCTDGLHNYVQENRIVEILGADSSAEERVATLIEEAKKGGGGDNITLSLAWDARPTKPKQPSMRGAVVEADGHLKVHVDDEG